MRHLSISSFGPAITPAVPNPCPLKYFVAECTTRSAPRSRAFCRYGDAKVESTIILMLPPFFVFTISEIALISEILRVGFAGVSTYTKVVFGWIAASIFSTFVVSTLVYVTPNLASTCEIRV